MKKLPLLALLAAGATLSVAGAGNAAGTSQYEVRAHVMFGGGSKGPFWVGDPVMISVRDSRGKHPKFAACWTPAPIDRPSCSGSIGAVSQAGTTTIKIKLTGKDVTLTKKLKVKQPDSSMSPNEAAEKHHLITIVTCDSPVLYANYKPKRGLRNPMPSSTVKKDDRVGWKYNYDEKVAQVFTYRTLEAGFILRSCISPDRNAPRLTMP